MNLLHVSILLTLKKKKNKLYFPQIFMLSTPFFKLLRLDRGFFVVKSFSRKLFQFEQYLTYFAFTTAPFHQIPIR